MSDSDDEAPVLSSSAIDALQAFYADRDARLKQFEDLKSAAEIGGNVDDDENVEEKEYIPLSMEAFAEDWNESQFWYSDETATAFAEELLKDAGPETCIAVVSAPSVFIQVKNLLAKVEKAKRPKVWLLEFDTRFEVFKEEFVFYDFKAPMKLPPELRGRMNHIIVDPPFLSEDCQTKAAMTVRWLSKSWGAAADLMAKESRLIACTGERMSSLITKLYRPQGVLTTTFEPVHAKGLSNEFFCYANFECEKWKWRSSST